MLSTQCVGGGLFLAFLFGLGLILLDKRRAWKYKNTLIKSAEDCARK